MVSQYPNTTTVPHQDDLDAVVVTKDLEEDEAVLLALPLCGTGIEHHGQTHAIGAER